MEHCRQSLQTSIYEQFPFSARHDFHKVQKYPMICRFADSRYSGLGQAAPGDPFAIWVWETGAASCRVLTTYPQCHRIVFPLRSAANIGGAHDTIRISGRENCHWLAIRHSRHKSHREAEATGVQSRLDSGRRPACDTRRRENLNSRICRPADGEAINTAPRSDRVAWVGVMWLAIEMTGFGCTLPSEPPPHHVRSSPNSGPPSANV